MPQLRRDPITGRWIIINVDSPKVPGDFEVEDHTRKGETCPFCPHNEKMTPPEVVAYGNKKRKPDTAGWSVRVVPNKYPALEKCNGLDKAGVGIFDRMNGMGCHEVIIETPDHNKEMPEYTDSEMGEVIAIYKERMLDLQKEKRCRYILVFKNYGLSAGASLEHTHSQLIAMPVIPKRVLGEITGAKQYFGFKDRCVFCDMIRQETEKKELTVAENKDFVSCSPFVPRFAYEMWILPKNHKSDFATITSAQIKNLAKIMKETLLRLRMTLHDPSYNFMIHTSPCNELEMDYYHWHIEIIPKLTRVAGFEWGTGFYINPTPPEVASKTLREITL
jgi:UDPglucose--hexose-1-phosphate uridylyltransferase